MTIARGTAMAEPNVYLEKLSAFSRLLRLQGLAVGTRETGDAALILANLGMEDREMVKAALRTVYASSREEQLTFDRVFDGFFISEEAMRRQAQEQHQREQEMEQRRRTAQEELDALGQQTKLTQQQRETYMTMPDEARKRLTEFAKRYKSNMERNPGLYSEFIHTVFTKSILE